MSLAPTQPTRRGPAPATGAVRDIGKLFGGRLAGKLIQVAAIPVVARLFEPALFGQAAFLIAIATSFNLVSSLAYEEAIILPRGDAAAKRVSRLAWVLLAATSSVFAVTCAVLWPARWLPGWMHDVPGWWAVLTALVVALGAGNIFEAWALRRRAFGAIARSSLVEAGTSAGGRIGWGALAGQSLGGLLTPYLASIVMRVAVLAGGAATRGREAGAGAPRDGGIDADAAGDASLVATARRYAHFPLYGMPGTLLRALSDRIPLLLLGALYLPAAAGLYAAANRLLQTPVQSLAQAVRKVVLQRAAQRRPQGAALMPIVLKATAALALVGAAPFALIVVYGDPLLGIVLGARWAEAGRFAEAIAPWGFTMLIVGPPTAMYQALEMQRWLLVVSILRVALFGAIAVALIAAGEAAPAPLEAVRRFALAGAAANLVQILVGLWLAGRHDRRRADARPALP